MENSKRGSIPMQDKALIEFKITRCFTRPDVALFAQKLTSRFQPKPGDHSPGTTVKNILKYLRSAVDWSEECHSKDFRYFICR
ncbi:hypothetical protein Tco_0528367 [Tanacetum coccineum]